MANLKTYTEWVAAGRAVVNGAKAPTFAVDEASSQSVALFDEAQTVPLEIPAWREWKLISAEDRAARRHEDKKPTIRIRIADNGRLHIWCGANKKAIETLKKAGFGFSATTNRWTATRDDPSRTIAGFEARGYKVIVETLA